MDFKPLKITQSRNRRQNIHHAPVRAQIKIVHPFPCLRHLQKRIVPAGVIRCRGFKSFKASRNRSRLAGRQHCANIKIARLQGGAVQDAGKAADDDKINARISETLQEMAEALHHVRCGYGRIPRRAPRLGRAAGRALHGKARGFHPPNSDQNPPSPPPRLPVPVQPCGHD